VSEHRRERSDRGAERAVDERLREEQMTLSEHRRERATARFRLGTALAAVLIVLVSAGCAGVPHSSKPQVVKAVDPAGDTGGTVAAAGPKPGEDPRGIVAGFLLAAETSSSAARQFLTLDSQSKWQASPVFIVDTHTIKLPVVHGGTATVSLTIGQRVGQLDDTGVFTPNLSSESTVDQTAETFNLRQINGQWRIDTPAAGFYIDQSDFLNSYAPQPVYFYDSTETRLVPDLRWSALRDQQLLTWLMAQLLAGPRPELETGVVNEIPPQVDAGHVSVTGSDPIQIAIPGAMQIDAVGRQRLAAQLAYTLGGILSFSASALRITDGGRPVTISTVIGNTFDTTDFPGLGPAALVAATTQFYLRGGQIISVAEDKPVAGALGNANAGLTAIAVRGSDPSVLQVIGVSGHKVLVGATATGFTSVARVPAGPISRPSWDPGSTDPVSAWVGIGNGPLLYAVSLSGALRQIPVTPLHGAVPQGRVVTVQLSPDGARVALLLAADDGSMTVWVGSVVRSGGQVHVDGLEPITPATLKVTDLGWRDVSTLALVAADHSTRRVAEADVYGVSSDGSRLQVITSANLPGAPEAIAVAPGQNPVVVSLNSLWSQAGDTWVQLPIESASASVSSPVYSQ
jgi:Sporulation and spore germination